MTDVERIVRRLCPHIVVGLNSSTLTESEALLLRKYLPAGVIIFARNVTDFEALRRLTDEISSIYASEEENTPLIMADHEGGRTSVLAKAIGIPPSQMAAAMSGREGAVGELFRETSLRMLECGVNMSLGPVADINSEYLNPIIGTRAFGISEDQVSDHVCEAVKAMRATGILTCIKHFPGHGSTAGDSHIELPVTGKNIEQLRIKDLTPFERGIRVGADSVMTAHIAPVDRMIPSSLDGEVIEGILRKEMGYDGVVITDGLEMNGILTGSGLKGAAAALPPETGLLKPACVMRSALEAGNDILLFTRPAEEVFSEIEEVLPLMDDDLEFWEDEFPAISHGSLPGIERLRGTALKAIRKGQRVSGIYHIVGSGTVTVRAERAGSLATVDSALDPIVFYGEKADFCYYPVVSFMERLLEWFVSEGGAHIFDPDMLEPARRAISPATGEEMDLLSWTPKTVSGDGLSGTEGVVVLLGRRPISGEDIEALTGRAGTVVVAEWPWASEYVPGGKRVVVTYGVCDSSADAVARILYG